MPHYGQDSLLSSNQFQYAREFHPRTGARRDELKDLNKIIHDGTGNEDLFVVQTPEGYNVAGGLRGEQYYEIWEIHGIIVGGAVRLCAWMDWETRKPLPIDRRTVEWIGMIDRTKTCDDVRKKIEQAKHDKIIREAEREGEKLKEDVFDEAVKDILEGSKSPNIAVRFDDIKDESGAKKNSRQKKSTGGDE